MAHRRDPGPSKRRGTIWKTVLVLLVAGAAIVGGWVVAFEHIFPGR